MSWLKNFITDPRTIEYCRYLADQYNITLEGKYRIKYNALHSILYEPITINKKQELFKSFASSLNIKPIIIVNDEITFIKI